MWNRRTVLRTAALAALASPRVALGQETPGVTATEIKIGNTFAYSGPASGYGTGGKALSAFFRMINEQGGINGRKINFISLDDGYSPPKTVEQTRRLVEEEGVAFIFQGLGTPTQSAVLEYMNRKGVPQLFVSSGADKFSDPERHHWTMGWLVSYRTTGAIFGKYILQQKPDGRIGVLYQNDDFGKDYLIGLRQALGDRYAGMVVKEASYEVTDPTIDSQAVALQSAGANVVITVATLKFGAQMIRKIADLNWKPLHMICPQSSSVGGAIKPAGPEKAVGLITAINQKDNTDPQWANDPGMNEWRAFMKAYLPEADLNDANYPYAYGVCLALVQVLKQCGSNLSRENIMRQAANLHDLELPILLPGMKVNTSPTNYHPNRSLQMQRFNGKNWELFGPVIAA
jgi:branched-chain amino acid transport system substrate-binding protein